MPNPVDVVMPPSGLKHERFLVGSDQEGLAEHCCWRETQVVFPFTSARIGRELGHWEFVDPDPDSPEFVVATAVVVVVVVVTATGAYV